MTWQVDIWGNFHAVDSKATGTALRKFRDSLAAFVAGGTGGSSGVDRPRPKHGYLEVDFFLYTDTPRTEAEIVALFEPLVPCLLSPITWSWNDEVRLYGPEALVKAAASAAALRAIKAKLPLLLTAERTQLLALLQETR